MTLKRPEMALARKLLGVAVPIVAPDPDEPAHQHSPPGDTRHDPPWLALHDAHIGANDRL